MIHRPAVGSSLGHKSSPSLISLADSSKHIIQIVQLLEERNMSFSLCLNKNELLTLCGLSILYQRLDLKQEGKLMQDGQRLVGTVIRFLEKANAPGAADFKRLAMSMIPVDPQPKALPGRSSTGMVTPTSSKSTPSPTIARQQIQPQLYRHGSTAMSDQELLSQQEKLRRATMPNLSAQRPDATSRARTPTANREYMISAPHLPINPTPRSEKTAKPSNLDYLSLSNTPVTSQPPSPAQARSQQAMAAGHTPIFLAGGYSNMKTPGVTLTEWEALLGSLDGGQTKTL